MEIKYHRNYHKKQLPKETLCKDCGQLRLNYIGAKFCGHCGSKNIIIGKVGELKK